MLPWQQEDDFRVQQLKDTSIRLTSTLQVSMLKPSVLMSLPVKRRQEVRREEQQWEELRLTFAHDFVEDGLEL